MRKGICLVALALIMLVGVVGCGMPGDPMVDNMYTRNVYPGSDNTYDIGSPALTYDNGYFNNLILSDPQYFYPDALTITNGTYTSGTLDSLKEMDGDAYKIKDEAVADGLLVYCTYNNVDRFTSILASIIYVGADTEGVQIELYNPTTGLWEGYSILAPTHKVYDYYSPIIKTPSNYISPTGQVLVRIHHWDIGIITDSVYINMLILKRN